jgi:hypothetical protein
MAGKKVDQSSAEYKTRLAGQRARTKEETKKREKAAGSSIKAGVKSAMKAAFGTGEAARAKDKIQKNKARNRKSLDY